MVLFDPLIQQAFQARKAKFNKYFEIMSNTIIYFVATILDPRIKGAWIQKHHPNGEAILRNVRQYIHEIYLLVKLIT